MEAYRGAMMLSAAVLTGFILLSVTTCSKKNDFESCFDRAYGAFTGEDSGAKTIGAARLCSATPHNN
jgi:hypothetical protein